MFLVFLAKNKKEVTRMRKRRRAFCSRACRHNSTTELQGNSSGALLLLVLHRAWLTTPCSDLSDLLTKRVRVLSKLVSIISAMIGRRSWLSYQFMSGRVADVRVPPLVFGHKYPNFFRHYSKGLQVKMSKFCFLFSKKG